MPVTNKRDAFASDSPEFKSARKIAKNTWRFSRDGANVIRLHRTDIVTQASDGRVILDSGGYRSMTTKGRMNDALSGYRIWSHAGLWMVHKLSEPEGGDVRCPPVPYYDGIVLPDAFTDKGRAKAEKASKATRATIKRINLYVAKVRTMPVLPTPGSGDCWICGAHSEQARAGRFHPMGVARGDGQSGPADAPSCLREHISAGQMYVHGSLLVNAARWAGWTDFAVGSFLSDKPGHSRALLCSAVRRYLKRMLGVG